MLSMASSQPVRTPSNPSEPLRTPPNPSEPIRTLSQSVLVTGCSSGIGHATALRCARAASRSHRAASGDDRRSSRPPVATLALDVTDEIDARAVAAAERDGALSGWQQRGLQQSGALPTLPMESCARSSRQRSGSCA